MPLSVTLISTCLVALLYEFLTIMVPFSINLQALLSRLFKIFWTSLRFVCIINESRKSVLKTILDVQLVGTLNLLTASRVRTLQGR